MISETISATLAPYRVAFRELPIPAVVIPDAISPALAESLRARLHDVGIFPFDIANRGRYAQTCDLRDPDLEAKFVAIAAYMADTQFEIASMKWLRFAHGDYALTKDDTPPVSGSRAPLELTLDLSETATGEAEVVYTRRAGEMFFVAPQEPRSLAIVQRAESVRRYERYLTHRVGDAEVVRLRMTLV